MPGCGKSTVGAALAKRLDKNLWIWTLKLSAAPGIISPTSLPRRGEAAFRRYETDVLAEVAKSNSQVIACGGGVIKEPANTRALRQNGPCCGCAARWRRWLPADAALKGRRGLKSSFEAERTPLYEAASTVVLENYGTLTAAVDKAVQLFEADETVKAFPSGKVAQAPDEGRAPRPAEKEQCPQGLPSSVRCGGLSPSGGRPMRASPLQHNIS